MILTIAAVVLILAIALFQVTQGVFSAIITTILAIISAMIAFNFYEPVASALLYSRQPGTADAGVLLALFIISLFGLRELFDVLIKQNLELGVWPDRIVGGLLGVVTGTIMVGVLMVALQMLPVAKMFGFEPFDSSLARKSHIEPLRPDEVVVSMMKSFSSGAWSGDSSMQTLHEDLLQESFAANNDAGKNSRTDATPGSIMLKAVNVVVQAKMPQDLWKSIPKNPMLSDPSSPTVFVVRVHVDDEARDAKEGQATTNYFMLPATQFRMVSKSGKDYYPVAYLTNSTADKLGWKLVGMTPPQTAERPADSKANDGLTGLIAFHYLPDKPQTLNVDWVYRLDPNEVPDYIVFRRVAKAEITKIGDNYAAKPEEALQREKPKR